MIPHYKKQAIKRFVTALLIIASTGFLLLFRKLGLPDAIGNTIGVTLLIIGWVYYLLGCMSLCKARGYSDASILPILIFAFCLCTPVFLLIPVFIYFGLTDRTGTR
jgi:hypothetical protein